MELRLSCTNRPKCACVHTSVTKWCIVGYLSYALWDLWDGPKYLYELLNNMFPHTADKWCESIHSWPHTSDTNDHINFIVWVTHIMGGNWLTKLHIHDNLVKGRNSNLLLMCCSIISVPSIIWANLVLFNYDSHTMNYFIWWRWCYATGWWNQTHYSMFHINSLQKFRFILSKPDLIYHLSIKKKLKPLNRWVNARKTELQCISNGVTSFLHLPVEMWWDGTVQL